MAEKNWNQVHVISVEQYESLCAQIQAQESDIARRSTNMWFVTRLFVFVLLTSIGGWGSVFFTARDLSSVKLELAHCQRQAKVSESALSVMTQTHNKLMTATDQVSEVGKRTWGRRFKITKYVPAAGGINADKDRFHTATMWKANPKNRIVAVDPTVIPYGSWVWIEGQGWFNAQDCGGAIKGYRIDVMSGDLKGAMQFGKQERFVIVIPPTKDNA